MSQLMKINETGLQPVTPRHEFTIRVATLDDFGWIDAMQKAESDKLGFLMRAAIEKRIEQGNVLVAEATGDPGLGVGGSGLGESEFGYAPTPQTPTPKPQPLGYCMAVDRYMKQDHVGQFIQLNVSPGVRRGLVGAALVQATFDKAAYGVRLYGLWCRQDLAANRFWEAMGFVPLAFRAAGRGRAGDQESGRSGDQKKRIHIYWQKRVRVGDAQTSYWFPYETTGGLMAESRVVLPIPPGVSWEDVMPVVLPGAARRAEAARMLEAEGRAKAEGAAESLKVKRKEAREAAKRAAHMATPGGLRVVHGVQVTGDVAGAPMGFDLPAEAKAVKEAQAKAMAAEAEKQRLRQEKREAKRAAKEARRQSDPELTAFSRELRDRWQEAAAGGKLRLEARGKYEVGRVIEGGVPGAVPGEGVRGLLEAA